MKKESNENKSKFFFILLLLVLAVIAFLMIRPFIVTILLAAVCAYIFYPFYKFIKKRIRSENVSAFIVTILIFTIIFLPVFFLFNTLAVEIYSSYKTFQQTLTNTSFVASGCTDKSFVCSVINYFNSSLESSAFRANLNEMIRQGSNLILKGVSTFLLSIPGRIFQLFVMFFTLFFLLRDSRKIIQGLSYIVSIKPSHVHKILKEFDNSLYAVVYGNILIAFVQGIVAAVGFYFLKVPSFMLWGFLTIIASLIPFIGPPIIWAPLAIFRMVNGYILHNSSIFWNGIIIFLYGFFIISTIDNILKPKIIGDRAKTHPLVIFFGIIGGLAFFGFAGIILGPIILTLFWTCFDIYKTEYLGNKT